MTQHTQLQVQVLNGTRSILSERPGWREHTRPNRCHGFQFLITSTLKYSLPGSFFQERGSSFDTGHTFSSLIPGLPAFDPKTNI
jgi:hypothetical protein